MKKIKIEIRSNDSAVIEGYVNAVERDSRLLPKRMCPHSETDFFYERMKAKTFERALASGKPVEIMLNHKRKIDGNLTLHEDNIGLYARAEISDTEVIEKARKGELRGWSFGFGCNEEDWGKSEDGYSRRTVSGISLSEVSIVDNRSVPCYIGTSIELRSEDCVVTEIRGIEETPVVTEVQPPQEDHINHCECAEKTIEILKMRGKIYEH